MENALRGDGVPHDGDGGGNTDGTSGSNRGAVSRAAKGTENGYLRASILRRGKSTQNLGTFPMFPKPPQATKGKDFPFGNLFASPVRTRRVGNDNLFIKKEKGMSKGEGFPDIFLQKYAKKTAFLCLKKAVSTIILCFLMKQNYIRFSGFRHSSSGRTKRPSLRMSTSSNQISPPPYSGVMISTKSQWIADLLPLGASS